MSTAHTSPHPGTGRAQFVADLASQRAASGKSFAALSRELDHPRSTLHGWCRGDHLPFPRDDEVFARLLVAVGIDDPDPWLETLRRLRSRAGRDNPYRGLEPYTEEETRYFHGRDALVDRLVAAVDGDRDETAGTHPLMVIGASGSGKTSLLRAGLLGRLRLRPGHATMLVTPGDDPVGRLDLALGRITGARAATLVIDQFEELFTIAPEATIDPIVATIATAQRAGIRVVIGARADFFHHLAAIPYLLTALDRRQVVVGPMTTRELTSAIVAPAAEVGLTLTPSLVAHLLQEFDEQAQRSRGTNALPLLSHVLFRLADGATSDLIGLADYQATGGLRDALQQTADDALARLPDHLHATCRQVFLQLVELRTDTTPTRRSTTRTALTRIAGEDAANDVLDAFVTRRLLTVERDTVALSHEALLTAWPTLRDWVDGQRNELLVRRRIRSAHRVWEETGEPVDGLLRGSLLDEAVGLLDGPMRSTIDEREREFVEASIREREATLARAAEVLSRQVASQSDLLGARDPSLSGHLALEAFGVADTVEARSALLRCVTAAAGPRFVGSTGPSAVAAAPSAGRAVAAYHADGTVEWIELDGGVPQRIETATEPRSRIHAVALDASGRVLVSGSRDGLLTVDDGERVDELTGPGGAFSFDGPVYAVVVSPDGTSVAAAGGPPGVARWRRAPDGWRLESTISRDVVTMGLAVRWSDGVVATASNDGVVALWDEGGWDEGGAPLWSSDVRPANPVASSVAFSPCGTSLAAGYHDGSVRVWSLAGGRPTERPLGSAAFATWVNAVEFSPDGVLLAAASSDGSVRLWDTRTWTELRSELRHPSVVSGVRFLADRWLITSSEDGIVRTWDVSAAVTGSDASIWSAGFDAAGSTLVTASRTMLTIDRRAGSGDPDARVHVPAPAEWQLFSGVSDVADDASYVVAGTRSGAIAVFDSTSGERIGLLEGSLGPIAEGVTIVGDVVAAVDSGGRLHRWRVSHSSKQGTIEIESSDGLAVSRGTALAVVDVGDGLVAIPTEPGDLVVVDVAGSDVATERARFRAGEAFPIAVARRPGHPTLATGGADRAVSVWSIEDWGRPELIERVVGPAGHVMTIDVDRSGSRLAAGTTDGRIWIWEWHDDRLERWATVDTGEAGVYAVRFAPDGRHLVSAGPNQRVTWWPLDVAAATEVVRSRIGDPLTDTERVRLLPARG